MCVSVFICSHLCMWRSGSCVESLPQSFSTFCFKTISHSTWNSPVQLDRLSSKLHRRGNRCTRRPAFHMGSRYPDSSPQAHVVSTFLSERVSPGCSFDLYLYYAIYYIKYSIILYYWWTFRFFLFQWSCLVMRLWAQFDSVADQFSVVTGQICAPCSRIWKFYLIHLLFGGTQAGLTFAM